MNRKQKTQIFLLIKILLASNFLISQSNFEGIEVLSLHGDKKMLTEILKNEEDSPVVLYTWFGIPDKNNRILCNPCLQTLNRFNKKYFEELKNEYNTKFIALNLDKVSIEKINFQINNKYKWKFEIYADADHNYFKKTKIRYQVPQVYIVVNGKIVNAFNGFINSKKEAKLDADFIYETIKSAGKDNIYFTENGLNTTKDKAEIIRKVNYQNDIYKKEEQWKTGELKIIGHYEDKWLSKPIGQLIRYYKNGKEFIIENYNSQNKLDGEYVNYHEDGSLFYKAYFKNGKLWNIEALFDNQGNKLDYGNFTEGNGIVNRYDKFGKLITSVNFKNGISTGETEQHKDKAIKKEASIVNEINNSVKNDSIFKAVEIMPRFSGCENISGTDQEKKICADKKMLEFIYENITYPALARKNGIEGTVVIQFVIDKIGKILNPKIVRNIGAGTGEEALRVVRLMNKMDNNWIPGKQRGKLVNVQFNLPIKFRLDGGGRKIIHKVSSEIDPNTPASLYFIRSTGLQGGAVPFSIFMDNQKICKLNNNRYSIHEINPGEHNITMQFRGKKPKDFGKVFNILPGNSYYFELGLKQVSKIDYRLYFHEISKNKADDLMKSLKEDVNCN